MACEVLQNLALSSPPTDFVYRGQHIPAMTRDFGLTQSHPKDHRILALGCWGYPHIHRIFSNIMSDGECVI